MNIKTVTRWLVMSEFEMFLNVLGLFITTILLCLKLDKFDSSTSWELVFMPVFVADGLQTYFCIIVFIREFFEYGKFRDLEAVVRLINSGIFLVTRFLFKLFVYLILVNEGNDSSDKRRFHYATFPLFLHLVLLIFRSCRLKKYQVLK